MGWGPQLSGPQLHARRDAHRRQGALLRVERRPFRRDRAGRGERGGGAGEEGSDLGPGGDSLREEVRPDSLARYAQDDEGAEKHGGHSQRVATFDSAGDEGPVRDCSETWFWLLVYPARHRRIIGTTAPPLPTYAGARLLRR